MAINQGRVSNPSAVSYSDSNTYDILQGRQGEQVFAELHGKYYVQAQRGNLFIGSTPIAGTAIPISSSTSPTPCLWNPAGSGKNAVLVAYYIGYSGGTGVVGALGYYAVTGAGSAIGTAAPFSAFAATTPTNALIGAGNTSVMKWSSTGTCTLNNSWNTR
jgi:hypothetical protein